MALRLTNRVCPIWGFERALGDEMGDSSLDRPRRYRSADEGVHSVAGEGRAQVNPAFMLRSDEMESKPTVPRSRALTDTRVGAAPAGAAPR